MKSGMRMGISLHLGVLTCLNTGCTEKRSTAEEPKLTYSNPLSVQFGDPYVLLASDGRYYMYGTGAGTVDDFCAYSSDDSIHWKSKGRIYRGNTPDSWAIANFWAPEVYRRGGKFYMFFGADWRKNPTNGEENFRIGVVVSGKLAGPFRGLTDAPLFDPGHPVINGSLIENENGRTYLYYSHCCCKHPIESGIAGEAKKKGMFDSVGESWVYGVEVAPGLAHVIEEPVLLLRPPVKLSDAQGEWGSRSVTRGGVGRRWAEGSSILRHNGLYYMMYSANYFGEVNYAVGYAASEHLLGPFEKASNSPVSGKDVEKGGIVASIGHNSVTWSRDGKRMYRAYHGRTQKTGDEQIVFIDKMRTNEDGLLVVEGLIADPQSIQ